MSIPCHIKDKICWYLWKSKQQLLINEFHERVGYCDWYINNILPTFDDTIISYMRLVDDQPYIFSFNPGSDKPIYKLSSNYVNNHDTPYECMASNRKRRNGSRNKANSI